MKADIKHDRLLEVFYYSPMTGVFTRLIGRGEGNISQEYLFLFIDGETYRAHRLAWLYIHK